MAYRSFEEIKQCCTKKGKLFWEAVLLDDMDEREVSRADSLSKMKYMWQNIVETSEGYDGALQSKSGLSGGAGQQMEDYRSTGQGIAGDFMIQVMAEALKTGESNACMKRIVAAPTAGACGVLPAVLIPMYRRGVGEERIIESLYVAAGIGQVFAERAFISGAAGGCQAEIGTASAMAAGALVHIQGGDINQILEATSMAMKMLLGLVCDPVAGLVEVPCIKRNVIGAVNAVAAADMALAGIISRIPVDEVVDAMKEVGQSMAPSLRETARGGLAHTKTGRTLIKELKMRMEENK